MVLAIFLVLTITLDALIAAAAYGAKNIKITFPAAMMVTLIGTSFFAFSLFAGTLIRQFLPLHLAKAISFALLFAIGFNTLMQTAVKAYITKIKDKKLNLKWKDVHLVVAVYLDETKADFDHSHHLSFGESIYLGLALSVDSLATGLGSAIGGVNIPLLLVVCFVFHLCSIYFGFFLGRRARNVRKINFNWVSGVILIALSFLRFLSF